MRRTRSWKALWALVLAVILMYAPPTVALDITVTTTNDVLDAAGGVCADVIPTSLPGPDGLTSLREAMCAANNNEASDTIRFGIPGCGGVCTIRPTIALPVLAGDGTTIDGYTQPGSAQATTGTPATLLVEIDGSNVLNNNGLNVASAGNVIRGLVINRFGGNGIAIASAARPATSSRATTSAPMGAAPSTWVTPGTASSSGRARSATPSGRITSSRATAATVSASSTAAR